MKKEEKEKMIRRYLSYDRKLNNLDLVLWQTEREFEMVDGRTEQEQNLLGFLEKEIHDLQYTIECLKNEMENNRFQIEESEVEQ